MADYDQWRLSPGLIQYMGEEFDKENSMNFMSDAEGTKAMFMKEKRSRKAFYDKLARGMSFKKAMAEEDYFVDDDQDENGQV